MPPDMRDPRTQKFVLGGIFLLGFIFIYYSLVYTKQREEIAVLQVRLDRIERHVNRVKIRIERENIDDLSVELSSLENQLKSLERLLPRAEEVPDLLEMVERKGIQAGIRSILFEPVGSRESNQYRELVYNVSVRGGYHEIGTFLSRVGSSSRIVKTSKMVLVPQKEKEGRNDRSVVAKFEFSTFILPEEGRGKIAKRNESNG